jgi:hypothetical protein
MRILGITGAGRGEYAGYIEDEEGFRQFLLTERHGLELAMPIPAKNYETFAQMIGKWDVHAILTKTPVEVEEITPEILDELIATRPDLTVSMQFTHY